VPNEFIGDKVSGPLRLWGWFRFMWTHINFYIMGLIFANTSITAFKTAIDEIVFNQFGVHISFWLFAAMLIMVILTGMLMEYKVSIPYMLTITSEQTYKYTPLSRDHEEIIQQNKDLSVRMGRIEVFLMGEEYDPSKDQKNKKSD